MGFTLGGVRNMLRHGYCGLDCLLATQFEAVRCRVSLSHRLATVFDMERGAIRFLRCRDGERADRQTENAQNVVAQRHGITVVPAIGIRMEAWFDYVR